MSVCNGESSLSGPENIDTSEIHSSVYVFIAVNGHSSKNLFFFTTAGISATVKSVLQLGFEGRGVQGRALFVWSYKNEGTMCHVMC